MTDFRVVWEIDIFDADGPEDAARKALEIQRDSDSIAVAFEVIEPETSTAWQVDLDARPNYRVTP